jgi:hypothetical protein
MIQGRKPAAENFQKNFKPPRTAAHLPPDTLNSRVADSTPVPPATPVKSLKPIPPNNP